MVRRNDATCRLTLLLTLSLVYKKYLITCKIKYTKSLQRHFLKKNQSEGECLTLTRNWKYACVELDVTSTQAYFL